MSFLVGNDEYVEIAGVHDAATGAAITSGTCTAQFYADDQSTAGVLAQTGATISNAAVGDSFSITYDSDDKVWRGTKAHNLALANGTSYFLVATLDDGSGGNAQWTIYDTAEIRLMQ